MSMQSDAVFTAKSQPHRRAVVEDMLQAMKAQKNGKAIILDARSKGQFTGEVWLLPCNALGDVKSASQPVVAAYHVCMSYTQLA